MSFLSTTQITKKKFNEPSHTIDLSEYGQIINITFSPFEWSQDVMLIAFKNCILLANCNFESDFRLEKVSEFKNTASCQLLAISPETSLNVMPNNVIFSAVGNDCKIRIYKFDLDQNKSVKVLSDHTNYINDIAFDPENNFLASVSDDNTARLWETDEYTCAAVLHLTSPGMSTSWHKEDSSKLLVAEKVGIIRFYNVNTHVPILSVDYGKPLSSAHWAPFNSQLVASLQLGELIIWDLTRPSVPAFSKLLYTEACGNIKFCTNGELIAAVNPLESILEVLYVHDSCNERLSATVTIPTNITWHFRLPLLCLGDDTKLCFWKIVPN